MPGTAETPRTSEAPSAAETPSTAGAPSTGGNRRGQRLAVVAPANPTPQPSTYVLSNGVALPLPRQYITNGSVDQGVDYAAPGGTPLYAMGEGVIIGEGISGFGPNAPILQITSGPLKGMEVYYGHAGPDLVQVGQHVTAGQQISEVGYGIVGISTGPHLEIGFYPPGPMGAGSRMLSVINSLMSQHPAAHAAATRMVAVRSSHSQTSGGPRARVATVHARRVGSSQASTLSNRSNDGAAATSNTTTGGTEAPASQPSTTAQYSQSDATTQTEQTGQATATTQTSPSEAAGSPEATGSSVEEGSSEATGFV